MRSIFRVTEARTVNCVWKDGTELKGKTFGSESSVSGEVV